MKTLLLLMFFASAAGAETILGADNCGTLKQCISIPNDQGSEISIYAGIQYPWVNLYIDGVRYYSPSGNGMLLDNLLFTDDQGDIVYLSGTFTNFKTCNKTGRGQSCQLHWSFTGGTIQ